MASFELRTFSATDGYRFYYRHYPAAGRPRGRIVFLHGIRSHAGWYGRSCEAFAAAGYEVFFLDRRGSGLNTAHRGDTPNFRRLLDDVAEFLLDLRRTQPWLPIHLAGISWGGKLAVGLPYRKPGLVSSLVLLCPGLCPKVGPSLGQRIAIGRARVRNPSKLFTIPLSEPELFTGSPEWQKFIDANPHDLREATARFLFGSTSLDIYLKRAAKRVAVPSLLLLAEHDRIIDNARTKEFVQVFPTPPKIVDYAGAHHTLEFETNTTFVADILAWLAD
ncbi:MAG: alpha/beta fold hydrolase [Planctomycetia bacterium]|nr:alpha/beta fold hydrolase [Planctomycetia bacterium]